MIKKIENFTQIFDVNDSSRLLGKISYEIDKGLSKNCEGYRVLQVVISACNTQALIIWEKIN